MMTCGEVIFAQSAAGSDLRRFLSQQRRPERKLTLALESRGFGVDPADDDHVLVQGLQSGVVDVGDPAVIRGVASAFAIGRNELDQLILRGIRIVVQRHVHSSFFLPASAFVHRSTAASDADPWVFGGPRAPLPEV